MNNTGIYFYNLSITGIGVPGPEVGSHYGAVMISTNGVLLAGTITLQGDSRISARGSPGGSTIAGRITGTHALTFGMGGDASLLILTNHTNNWTGDTTIGVGITRVSDASTATTGVIPHGAGFGNVILFGGDANGDPAASTLDIFGFDTIINGLSSAGDISKDVVTNSNFPVTLSVGDNNQTATYAGTITANVSLAKIGSGTQTLGGINTYFGATAVNKGTLLVNGSHNGGGDYTVASGATLGGNGTISAKIQVPSGGILSPGVTIGTLHAGGLVDLSGTLQIKLQGASTSVLDSTNSLNINTGAVANFHLLANIATTQFQFANDVGSIGGNGNGQFSSVTFTTASGIPAPTLDHIDYSGNHLTLFVTPQSLRGNFNLDNTVDVNDISAMLQALTDLPAYMNGGNPAHLILSIADMNRLGDFDNLGNATTLSVNNKELQPMLDYIASLPGTSSLAQVPEPPSLLLLALGAVAACSLTLRVAPTVSDLPQRHIQFAAQFQN